MANIPDVNFNKIPNKGVKFNQTEFYESNFEKINQQIVPKVNELDAQLADIEQEVNVTIPAQLSAITTDVNFPIKNYIANGNFSQGIAGWASLGGTSVISATNNIMSVVGNGASAVAGAFKETMIQNITGKKLYVRAILKVTNAECLTLRIRIGGTTGGSIDINKATPLNNELYAISGVVTLTSEITGGIRLSLIHIYNTSAIANGRTIKRIYG
jgi:hypothetical protein